jgi:hypothetical protein
MRSLNHIIRRADRVSSQLARIMRIMLLKPVVLLEKVLEVLKDYRLGESSEEAPLSDGRGILSTEELMPKIILSESFSDGTESISGKNSAKWDYLK